MATLLVTGAGTAAAENLISSLRAGDSSFGVLGCNDDRFTLKHSHADARFLLPRPGSREFIDTVRRLIRTRGVELVVPTNDVHVRALSDARGELGATVFLPEKRLIELCRDKYRLTKMLRARGIRAPETYRVTSFNAIDAIFARMRGKRPLWCRPRTGTCARGGAAVSSREQARGWIRLWQQMRGLPMRSFTLCEYLPGREILCQTLWERGRLILANTFERLSYFGVDNIPSGVTSLSSLAKTVHAPRVVELCRDAIQALTPSANGIFSTDVKEDDHGAPYITEINAGRFFMAMTAFDPVLKHNMALTYVRLALKHDVELHDEYDGLDDYYIVRDLDSRPSVFHAAEVLDGVEVFTAAKRKEPNRGKRTRRR